MPSAVAATPVDRPAPTLSCRGARVRARAGIKHHPLCWKAGEAPPLAAVGGSEGSHLGDENPHIMRHTAAMWQTQPAEPLTTSARIRRRYGTSMAITTQIFTPRPRTAEGRRKNALFGPFHGASQRQQNQRLDLYGDPGRIRTCDPLLRRQNPSAARQTKFCDFTLCSRSVKSIP